MHKTAEIVFLVLVALPLLAAGDDGAFLLA
jgi:hypothetical protein